MDLTAAFGVFANEGVRIPPVAITRIEDFEGNLLFEYQTPDGEQVVRPEHAFLISSILSDNNARTPAFGPNSPLNLPFPAAAKTGTTSEFKDNWTVGYTPDIAVGVWVGNPDNTSMVDTSGLTGAAPIWAEFMQLVFQELTGGNPTPFNRPSGVVDRVICAVSGTEPSQWCSSSHRSEFFASDQLPLPASEDLWQPVQIDTWTGLLSSPECSQFTDAKLAINVDDPWGIEWITSSSQGRGWAQDNGFSRPFFFGPDRECTSQDPRPILEFAYPREGDT